MNRIVSASFALATMVAAASCTEMPSASELRKATAVVMVDGTASERVAQALAVAFNNAAIRKQLLEDLRDSPFANHKLHVKSYLTGKRGLAIIREAARQLGVPENEILTALQNTPDAELWVPVAWDRVYWTGGRDVVVAHHFTKQTSGEVVPNLNAYDVNGNQLAVPTHGRYSKTIIMLSLATGSFGPDPEGQRMRAPKRQGNTISNRESEVGIMAVCDTCTSTGPEPWPAGVLLNDWNWSNCYSSTGFSSPDNDMDSVNDDCEFALAEAFRPRVVWHQNEVLNAGEGYWAVERGGNSSQLRMRILYLPALYKDGPPYEHNGDSEFAEFEVDYNSSNGRWQLAAATLSAHWMSPWFPGGGDWTARYDWTNLSFFGNSRARPYVFASLNHHGLYNSESRCDSRAGDECSGPGYNMTDFAVFSNRNIGNEFLVNGIKMGHLVDCVQSIYYPAYLGTECFWTKYGPAHTFAGWQGSGGTTHHHDILQYYGWAL